MSKVDINIFALYLSESNLSEQDQKEILKEFKKEYKMAVDFVKNVTGEKDLLWYRPWLSDSIKLRSSMIHPLNLLQIIGYQNDDMALVRKTVAGISSGMMTTG